MDFARISLLALLAPLVIACEGAKVDVLRTVDAGHRTDAEVVDSAPTDIGAPDSGAADLGAEDAGLEDASECVVLANADLIALEGDSARSGPRTEARADEFAVLREADLAVHGDYTPELHRFSPDGELVDEHALLELSGSFGVRALVRMGFDFGAAVTRPLAHDLAFKANIVADGPSVVHTATSAERILEAATLTDQRVYFTSRAPDHTRHAIHTRGIFDDFASDHRIDALAPGFPAFDPQLHFFEDRMLLLYVQDWESPRTLMLQRISADGELEGSTVPTLGCGVESYDVVILTFGKLLVVADCADSTVLAVYERWTEPPVAYVTVNRGTVEVASQVAWDQGNVGVVFWPSGATEPRIQFFDVEGASRSSPLPLPAVPEGGEPVGMDASAARPNGETARWVVAYTYRHPEPFPPGTTYLARFDGCPR